MVLEYLQLEDVDLTDPPYAILFFGSNLEVKVNIFQKCFDVAVDVIQHIFYQ